MNLNTMDEEFLEAESPQFNYENYVVDENSENEIKYDRGASPSEQKVEADAEDEPEDEADDNVEETDEEYEENEESEYDSEEDSEDEDSRKKLEREIDTDTLLKSHPEIVQNNYQEILALCKIVRNNKGQVIDDLHKTYPFISKYEYARIIGIRSKQLNNGADPFIEVDRNIIDGFTIAKLEMDAKKIPFIISRPLPNGSREYWKIEDLELVHF